MVGVRALRDVGLKKDDNNAIFVDLTDVDLV